MSLVLIQAQVLSASAPSVTFSGIPQTFKTLKLVVSARSDYTNYDDVLMVQLNGATSGYAGRRLWGTGSSTASDSLSNVNGAAAGSSMPAGAINGGGSNAYMFGSLELTIPDYAGSLAKAIIGEGVNETNASGATTQMAAGAGPAAAIVSLTLLHYYVSNFVAGSTFYLYGLS